MSLEAELNHKYFELQVRCFFFFNLVQIKKAKTVKSMKEFLEFEAQLFTIMGYHTK